jgi:DNA-binding transcriptional ArsR family regulator
MNEALIPKLAQRFKALGDPGRLVLLARLQEGEKSVGELVAASGRSQPNVSQHLANLARAGLVSGRRQGSRIYYRIADAHLARICDAVCRSLTRQAEAERRQVGRAPRRPRRV